MAVLEATSISHAFGPVQALAGVSARFVPGEIHAVLGENGAGKSTLMNVLAGFLRPDVGAVTLDGRALPLGDPLGIRALGVEMVHQHFMLVPAFSVAENLALARLGGLRRPLDTRTLATPALDMAKRLGWPLDPSDRTATLPVGVQQRIEILKALSGDAGVLILDEPTAVLAPDEVLDLFRVMRSLRDEGKTLVLIAHKLSEVLQVADRVTVLRRGRFVASAPVAETNETQLAEWIVGEMPSGLNKTLTSGPVLARAAALSVRGDRGEQAVRGVDFEVRRGEVLGIGGVDGNGQVELAEALAGVRPFEGTFEWAEPGTHAVGYIPQDRHHDGLALGMSLLDNFLIAGHRRKELTSGPAIRTGKARGWAQGLIERYSIKAGSVRDPARSLSGGNQQKVVVSRALDAEPDLLVAVNPTRGLDLKAADFVHRTILETAARGAGVVLVSTDLDELAAIATRTLFMTAGTLREGAEALVGGSA